MKKYKKELQSHIVGLEDRIKLGTMQARRRYEKSTGNKTVNTWYASIPFKRKRYKGAFCLNEIYLDYFQLLSKEIGVHCPFTKVDDILMNNPSILERAHKDIPEDFDILLVNSRACSGQYKKPASTFDTFVDRLKDRYKIIVTRHLDSGAAPCTLDYGLNLMQIGNISTKVKYVIAIATGPIIPCLNKWSIDTVQNWAILSNRSTYNYRENMSRYTGIMKVIKSDFFNEE